MLRKVQKVPETSYITLSYANFGIDLKDVDKLKIEEVVQPMGQDIEKKKGSSEYIGCRKRS